jgi:hypothetical protein
LAARKRAGVSVKSDIEADLREAVAHAHPDFVTRNAKVLAPEGNIVADTFQDDLAIGILDHEARATALCCRMRTINEQRSL